MTDAGLIITIVLGAAGLYFVYRQMRKADLEDTGYGPGGGGRDFDQPNQDHK